jgi:adenine-specific DNA-methyltransferase
MTGESLDIQKDQLEKLKQLFPETITEGKIDWEKLQATLGKENIEFQNERYVLNWAGKSEAFKVLQQSTTATLKPVPEESINFETSENVFIEGENLEVLKVLQKSYYNKIKCIIIDPPYNTGNDSFIYPDSFKESKEDYQKRIGEKDEDGYLMKEGFFRNNSKDSGRYHSNWLSMMYPRLFLAKNLLRDDGVIFVHIDDNEVHNLRLMMNEILGEENFICEFIWKSRLSEDNRNLNGASIDHEYILCYQKNIGKLNGIDKDLNKFSNPDNDIRGPWRSADLTGLLTRDQRPNCHYDLVNPETGLTYLCPPKGWRYEPKTMDLKIKEKRILWPETVEGRPRHKLFMNEMDSLKKNMSSLITTVSTLDGSKELANIFGPGIFSFPKPHKLTKILLDQVIMDSDIVLDFFAGSGTTAQAVMELNKENNENRKFILVQLPEICIENSEAFKAGYRTIADISKERIRRVIEKIEKEKDVLIADNKKLELVVKEYNSELTKQRKDKPELNFEDSNVSKEAQKILDAVEKLGKKIELNNELIGNITNSDLGFKAFKLSSSNFKIWRGNDITEENLEIQLDAFTDPVREGSETENMLYELILKAGYLLTDKVELRKLDIISTSLNDRDTSSFYSVNEGELIIALEEMNQQLIAAMINSKPKKVITLDKLFEGNDQLKTNAVLQMRDAGIDFKTI